MNANASQNATDSPPTPRQTCLFVIGVLLATMLASVVLVSALGWWMANREVPGVRLTYRLDVPAKQVDDETLAKTSFGLRSLGFPNKIHRLDNGMIAVDVAAAERDAIEAVKTTLSSPGTLEFTILVPTWESSPAATQAVRSPQDTATDDRPNPDPNVRDVDGTIIGHWRTIGRESVEQTSDAKQAGNLRIAPQGLIVRDATTGAMLHTGGLLPNIDAANPVFDDPGTPEAVTEWMDQSSTATVQALTHSLPDLRLTAIDIDFAASTTDESGKPAVSLRFTEDGSVRLAALTKIYSPRGNKQYQLAVIVDGEIMTAPVILTTIRREARITGSFSPPEIARIVRVIKSAQIPLSFPESCESEVLMPVRVGGF